MKDASITVDDSFSVRVPMRLERRGGRKLVITPEGGAPGPIRPRRDEALVCALVKASAWRRRIESGRARSITNLAAQEGVTDAYVCRILSLTCLAPDIVAAIIDRRQPQELRLSALMRNVPTAWKEQRQRWSEHTRRSVSC